MTLMRSNVSGSKLRLQRPGHILWYLVNLKRIDGDCEGQLAIRVCNS